jgi:hypothetical protein
MVKEASMTQKDEYHWMLSYIVPNATGFDARQQSGTCYPQGHTRSEMYEVLAQQVADKDGITAADFAVTFFSLEPNELGTT